MESAPEAKNACPPTCTSELLVYGAARCHLCDEAMDVLRTLAPELGLRLRYVAIDGDPELERAHRHEIPVAFLGGRKVFKYRVDLARLRHAAAHRSTAATRRGGTRR
jgi:hypothetical protein